MTIEYAKIGNRESNQSDDERTNDDFIRDYENDECVDTAPSPYSVLPTDEDRETIINDALDELADIARENILEFKREDFNTEEVVGTWIDSYLCQYFEELDPTTSNFSTATAAEANALNDVIDAYIQELYNDIIERFYEEIAPPRISPATHPDHVINHDIIHDKIRKLQEKPQPEQRTPEWYERRNNLITASAASKAFGTQASVNQLIYEKCKNQNATGGGVQGASTSPHDTPQAPLQGPVNSPLHWGQRYEPVTVMVYEYRNNTTLGEFGCIQHDKYPFIGASPDGINIDATSPIYGRMVEIKNIVNREITGRPKEEYWIQTQIQMEVCDLDECDFVETRFKEYENKEEYDADGTTREGYTLKGNEKGIILWFQTAPTLTPDGHISQPTQLYEYAPIAAKPHEYDKWEQEIFMKHERLRSVWVRSIYWYLDEYSCVLVRRNRLWFDEAVTVLYNVWSMIEEERQTGYEHRAPTKRRAGTSESRTAAGTATGTELKIIKLETALSNGSEATATNMATLMAINTTMAQTNKKYGGGGFGKGRPGNIMKGPSEVLINCFKINDLEIDEKMIEDDSTTE
jgi:putative phage-type endonuclease